MYTLTLAQPLKHSDVVIYVTIKYKDEAYNAP